jgi:hypothetical protein
MVRSILIDIRDESGIMAKTIIPKIKNSMKMPLFLCHAGWEGFMIVILTALFSHHEMAPNGVLPKPKSGSEEYF